MIFTSFIIILLGKRELIGLLFICAVCLSVFVLFLGDISSVTVAFS